MLVKELRQGLRGPVFVFGFCVMHVVLGVMALLMGMPDAGSGEIVSMGFWLGVSLPLVVLLPARCTNALREEMSGNSMDTLLLTRLSPSRIMLGKWVSTAAMQTLIALTVMPYLIMRYFAGRINLPLECAWLGIFLLGGIGVAAIICGLSFIRAFLVRSVILLALLAGGTGICGAMSEDLSRGQYGINYMFEQAGWPISIMFLVSLGWLCFFFLDLGASNIAPAVENRSERRRWAATVSVLALAVTTWLVAVYGSGKMQSIGYVILLTLFGGGILGLSMLQAVCEVSSIQECGTARLDRRSGLRRLFFSRGWSSGVPWAMLMLVAGAGMLFAVGWVLPGRVLARSDLDDLLRFTIKPESLSFVLGAVGALFFPLVFWHLAGMKRRWSFVWWVVVTAAAFAFQALGLTLLSETRQQPLAHLVQVIPSTGMAVRPMAQILSYERMKDGSYDNDYMVAYHSRVTANATMLTGVSISCTLAWCLGALILALRSRNKDAAILRRLHPGDNP